MLYQLTYISAKPYLLSPVGQIIKQSESEQKRLAYRLKNLYGAYYQNFLLEATVEEIKTLEKKIRLDKEIIRHLIVKNPPLESASAIVKPVERPKRETRAPSSPEKIVARPIDEKKLDKKLAEIFSNKKI